MAYNPKSIDEKWKIKWQENQTYKVENNNGKPKFYVLDMFPYPSGSGLHVGHPLGYVASDIFARYKRLKGFNVLHPMGFDAFGLPAEQYAIETGKHPAVTTAENIATYKRQLNNIGLSFDWSREVNTSDPNYYKWTQWIFLKLFNSIYCYKNQSAYSIEVLMKHFEEHGNHNNTAYTNAEVPAFSAVEWKQFSEQEKADILMNYRLAYRKVGFVNWCEALQTVLANDEVVNGVSERGGHPVEQKPMLQWSLRITAYAERLLQSIDSLEWSDSLKLQQRNWIGKSEGARVRFKLAPNPQVDEALEVFTTRPDTIFGVTFMVLAPEHPLVESITTPEQKAAVEAYQQKAKSKSAVDRQAGKEVSGEFTGAYAVHPFTNEPIPVWISDYVLIDYGTGAIMAVPSDDDRDHAFATKFGLPIIDICDKTDYPGATNADKVGKIINSDFLNGLEVKDAITKAIDRIEELGLGERKINYKLRDANFSRQRYWGEPFPIYYDENGIAKALPVEELPLELPPMDDIKPQGGKAPLSKVESWKYKGMQLDTDTMPGNAGSSWYFLRYMDPTNPNEFCSKEALEYWQDVDLYLGGTEHAVGHLMYARFWHKFLYDLGYVPTQEPFKKLINQGMIQGMSAYTYRVLGTMGVPQIFVSSCLVEKNDFVYVKKIVSEIHQKFGIKEWSEDITIGFTPIPVNIKLLKSETELNIVSYKNSKDELINSEFILNSENKFLVKREVEKMSKSKHNVVNPDDVIAEYGADTFRMFEMFLGPIETHKPWNTEGIGGVFKFLRKFWNLFHNEADEFVVSNDAPTEKEMKVLHTCIKKVNDDIERFSFNTCVSAFMICVNELTDLKCNKRALLEELVKLLSPFAPHTAEELWEKLGHSNSVVRDVKYPEFEAKYLVESSVNYPVSINGKVRAKIDLPAGIGQDEARIQVISNDQIEKWLEGKEPKKFIFVPGRIINIVV